MSLCPESIVWGHIGTLFFFTHNAPLCLFKLAIIVWDIKSKYCPEDHPSIHYLPFTPSAGSLCFPQWTSGGDALASLVLMQECWLVHKIYVYSDLHVTIFVMLITHHTSCFLLSFKLIRETSVIAATCSNTNIRYVETQQCFNRVDWLANVEMMYIYIHIYSI